MREWAPNSWRGLPAAQQATYASPDALSRAVDQLACFPPLVTSWEIEELKSQLAQAAVGKRFLLQGGDCAESLADCRADSITSKLKVLLQMSLVLIEGGQKPVIRVGRFAGQYAKPRSTEIETRDGVSLPSYRGDIINLPGFTTEEREPNPHLMVRAYEHSALTLNFVRALVKGGFADLHHPENWDLEFAKHSPLANEYRNIAQRVADSLQFMESLLGVSAGEMKWVDFFTSHEGLHLVYEEALTRKAPQRESWYNLSTHYPWIGVRTADPQSAHVEYFRGIANPIAVKVGPETPPATLIELVEILNPQNEPGRLTFIHRYGKDGIAEHLPKAINAVRSTGQTILWCCDPMHGNTRPTADGTKTRHFDDILRELELAFEIHRQCDSCLGGIHIELTGENVTECLGGARNLLDEDLKRAYRSQIDPRLNYEQALEMAMAVARLMKAKSDHRPIQSSAQ